MISRLACLSASVTGWKAPIARSAIAGTNFGRMMVTVNTGVLTRSVNAGVLMTNLVTTNGLLSSKNA